jgi:hypothetical protein
VGSLVKYEKSAIVEAAVVKGKKAAQNVDVKLTKLLPTGFACYFVASAKAWLSFHSSSSSSPSSSFFLCTSVLPKDPRPSRFVAGAFPQIFQLK